jgi:hypothetical protein
LNLGAHRAIPHQDAFVQGAQQSRFGHEVIMN